MRLRRRGTRPEDRMREPLDSFRGDRSGVRGLRSGAERMSASGSPRQPWFDADEPRRPSSDHSTPWWTRWQFDGFFTAPCGPSTVTGPGPCRTSPGRRVSAASRASSALPPLCLSPTKRPHVAGSLAIGPAPKRRSRPGPCLSWGSSRCCPSTDISLARPLPRPDRSRDPTPAAPKSHGPTAPPVQHLVPPSWFRTTSTVSSARRTAGLLHPATGPGVRRVSRNPLPRSRCSTARALTGCRGETGSFPATLRPFEEFPPFPAVRCHHRLSCPLAVRPHRRGTLLSLPVAGSRW